MGLRKPRLARLGGLFQRRRLRNLGSSQHLDAAPKILNIAHRGAPLLAPENTLASFRTALTLAIDMIELDVHLTTDGHLIVMHDETLDRTTRGTGRIADYTLAQLQQFEAGSWFSPQFAGEPIPTLAEVFTLVANQVLLNVEVKSDLTRPGRDEATARALLALVREYNLEETVLISSFDPGILQAVRAQSPEIRLALLYQHHHLRNPLSIGRKLKVYSVNPHFLRATRRHIAAAHSQGFKVFSYTVDNPRRMNRLISFGIDGIFTNDPATLAKLKGVRNVR